MNDRRFAGKVVLVTGAGRGIGRAIALAFAEKGASVAVNYRAAREGAEQTAAEARKMGASAIAVSADVSNSADVTAMIERVERELGPLDILINNAGLFSGAQLFDITEKLWDDIQNTNLKGMFLCSQSAALRMLERGSGIIVNLVSGGGLSAFPGYDVSVAYASSKAGAIMLTYRLALELAPTIRVNAVAPGMIDSKPQQMSEAFRALHAAKTPLRRIGENADIAAAVLFLASDDAGFITGQVLSVDGGVIPH